MENLLSIWTAEGLLRDRNGDGVNDGTAVFIDLPDGLVPEGLIDFCARLGFETTALSFDFFEPKKDAVRLSFFSGSETQVKSENQALIFHYKNETELSTLLRLLAAIESDGESSFIELKDGRLYTGQEFLSTLCYRKEEGEAPADIDSLSHLWSFSGFGWTPAASPSKLVSMNIDVEKPLMTTKLLKELCCFAARSAMYATKIVFPVTGNSDTHFQLKVVESGETVLELVDRNFLRLKGKKETLPQALSQLARAKHWSEEGYFGYWEQKYQVSQKTEAPPLFEMEWSGQREVDLAFQVIEESENLEAAEVEIFLSEPFDVRKRLAEEWKERFPLVNSVKIRSAFKPGLHWIMEEILPHLQSYKRIEIRVQKENGNDGLELPIRWIQELYPVDRYIEEKIGIIAELVTFHLEKELAHTYEVYGIDEQGVRSFVGCLDVPVSKLRYIDGKRYVYPVSGAVRINEEERLIPTDRERFYQFYVTQVLPKLRTEVANYQQGQGHTRPLFDRIEIDVWMSEEERKLGVDEERISSLEALHEDLYFNTLDYFAYMGEELEGKPFNAPGGVHPFMHLCTGGKPEARIRVYRWEDKPLEKWVTNIIYFDTDGRLAEAKMTNGKEDVTLSVKDFEKPSSHIHPDVEEWLTKPSNYRILYPDHSYRGHAIPIIECFLDTYEEYYAPLKMSVFKKTIFIEAGHHSNEVSSTPAILAFIDRAEEFFKDWLKEFNVVILPLANPDGYELLTKLMEEHPEWKHHAARYNAVGLEYSFARFQDTVFGEANIYPEVFRRWAPDVIVDDHGIPSHEWVQPFAGYNSPPRFPVSYFLPSAKIYGIGRLSTGPNRPLHEENLEKIVSNISAFISDTTIEEENQYWQKRFIKYGNQWLPDVFPIEEAPGIHFYRQADVAPSYSTIGISRYPEWVAAEVISEAADEVVYGEVLQSCIEAHIVFDLGILEVLKQARIDVIRDVGSYQRIRPIQL